MTTTLDSNGAVAAARNRWWACSTPALTTATPYNHTCGANMTTSEASVSALPTQSALAKVAAYQRAPNSTASPAGVSTNKVQVIKAAAVRDACSSRRAP